MINNYTDEMYKEDLKLCKFVFKIYFKRLEMYKEDLIQVGLIACLHSRENYSLELGYNYSTYACSCIRYSILEYYKRNIKCHIDNSSLDEFSFDDSEQTILDTIPAPETDFDSILVCEQIKGIALNLVNQKKFSKGSKSKDILLKYIENNFSLKGLKEHFKVSRQCIHSLVDKFNLKLQNELRINGFCN